MTLSSDPLPLMVTPNTSEHDLIKQNIFFPSPSSEVSENNEKKAPKPDYFSASSCPGPMLVMLKLDLILRMRRVFLS